MKPTNGSYGERGWALGVALLCSLLVAPVLAAESTAPSRPAILEVRTETNYVTAGDTVRGVVVLALPEDKEWQGRLSVLVGEPHHLERPEEEFVPKVKGTGRQEVPFAMPAVTMCNDYVQAHATLSVGDTGGTVSEAWSAPVKVGVRRRIDLAGDWKVESVKVLEGDVPWRPKDWKMAPVPATIHLPGKLPFDSGFRGWVTLKRTVSWKRQGDLQPRAISIFGASDSARVRINGKDVGETAPVEDMAVLTHWVEFHSPYKGPENEQRRMLFLAGGTEYPVLMPLPEALPPEGEAEIELTLRCTSGGILGNPMVPYGILNDIHLELAPAVHIRSVSFDTEKWEMFRRFRFRLEVSNDTRGAFKGKVRVDCGVYEGELPYAGDCLPDWKGEQAVTIPPGRTTVEVVRDELPHFATCRATFLLRGDGDRVLDAAEQDYHTVAVDIRDRRDLYVNNERFIVKGQGSWGEDADTRLQLKIKGGNAFRAHRSAPSRLVPGFWSEAANIDDRYRDGLLTSAGGALLASCEKCTFWNAQDTSNIDKAVKGIIRRLSRCPGIIEWEATNELHGEPEEARVAILDAFHKYDPYHRPVMATKGSGEWEAEARDGRVAGVDIVGCQYLLSKEAVDSVTAAVTEQPLMSTEVNWNDTSLYDERRMYETWLDKGLCGSLFFDYSGSALTQPVPLVPPADGDQQLPWHVVRESQRLIYQDMVATAVRQADGRVLLTLGNQMPYALRGVAATVRGFAWFHLGDIEPGGAVRVLLPPEHSPPVRERAVVRAEYVTHGGLKHFTILSPVVTEAPAAGGAK